MKLIAWSGVALLALACGGEGATTPSGVPAAGHGGATGGAGTGGGAGSPTSAPSVLTATFVPYANVPLGGALTATTDRDATLKVELTDGGSHALTLTTTASGTTHAVPVLQLRAGKHYTIEVTALDATGGASATATLAYSTPPLPADFPPLVVKAKDATRDGLTLFGAGRWGAMGPVQDWSYLAAVDGAGEVVWYLHAATSVNHINLSPAGDVRIGAGDGSCVDLSVSGEPRRAWVATARLPAGTTLPTGVVGVDVDTLHHDLIELPNGHLLALSTERRKITKEMCPATYEADWDVVGDVVVELVPATGEIVRRVSMFDLLDPCRRVDQPFKTNFWNTVYGAPTADWTHANAVYFDAARNAVWVSLRHQDWVIAYRYADDAGGKAGSLLYRLGPEGDFQLAGADAAWNYQQHAARVLPNGHIMMYDNGSARPGTSPTIKTKYPWSRSLELELDLGGPKGTWTATQVWEYGTHDVRTTDTSTGTPIELRWFSQVVGVADVTSADTVLAVHGAATDPPDGLLINPAVKKFARIFEVTREPTPKVVLDVRVHDEAGDGSFGVYRAVRIPTLYPKSSGVTAKVTER